MRKENNQATDARDECSKSSDRSCYRGASLEEEVQANVIGSIGIRYDTA
jgi:hypothetical protein